MFKSILKFLGAFLSILLLIYLLWPYNPTSIEDFSPLPDSSRSTLSGDTVQVANLKAYFSNSYRNFVIPFYLNQFQQKSRFPFPPLRLNHPPEYAYQMIKDQTQSTYLEEFTYPLRNSIFINGLEPFDESTKQARYPAASYFEEDGKMYETKVTLRYYPSSVFSRFLVWLGVNVSAVLIWKVGRKVIANA